MGMEYLRTNNKSLSRLKLLAAEKLCAHDPVVYNELGVMAFRQVDYADAAEYFLKVLALYHQVKCGLFYSIKLYKNI